MGDGAQLKCFTDYSDFLDDQIYLWTLNRTDLTNYRAIVIPDFSNQVLLTKHARQINDYLGSGGF